MSISSLGAEFEELLFSTKKRIAGTLAGIILLLSIPVSLSLVAHQQDFRQQASSVKSAAIAECRADGTYCGTAGAPLGGCCSGVCDCSVDNNNCTCKPATGPTCGGNVCASGEVCCPGFYICGNPSSCTGCSVFLGSICGCYDMNSNCPSGNVCTNGTCAPPSYTVSGSVFIDLNSNGIREYSCYGDSNNNSQYDAGEPTYSSSNTNCTSVANGSQVNSQGVNIRLMTGSELLYSGNPNVSISGVGNTTAIGGFYSQGGVSAGSHTITLTVPAGYVTTSQNPATVNVTGNTTQNFGIIVAPPTPTPTPTPRFEPTNTPTPTPTTRLKLVCDPNDDGVVDFLDFQWWKDEFTKVRSTSLADCNNDDAIDLLDFQIWKNIAIFKLSPTP